MRKTLGDKPKERLANAGWMLAAVDTIRNIAVGTKSEVYQIGAESAVRFLVDTGNNELPRRKDKEDDLAFARRCHQCHHYLFHNRVV